MNSKTLVLHGSITVLTCVIFNQSHAAAGDASFTPANIVVPVTEISLRNGRTVGSVLYSCAGSLADCRVDITSSAALTALSMGANINTGSYDRVVIETCRDGDAYDAAVTGIAVIDGINYYTTTPATPGVSDVLSTDSADLGPVTVTYRGCVHEYLLPKPVTVADGDNVVINLFVNLENIAWARTARSIPISAGCASNVRSQAVCTAYSAIVASVGVTSPKVQTYHVSINGSGQIDGQYILLFNTDGTAIGGFARPYYDANNSDSSGFSTPLRVFSLNNDGVSYTFGNYGGAAGSYTRLLTDFVPGTAAGSVTSGFYDFTSLNNPGEAYSATLQ